MPYSTHKGVRLYYDVHGEGPPMVLLHATPWDRNMWLYQVAHFSTWFRLINIDMRSFGLSDVVRTPFTMEDMVEETIALCQKENVVGAVVMGASLGSRIAYCLGHDRPDMFKAAIVVGGNAQAAGSSESDRRRAERIRRYREGPVAETYEWQLRGTLSEGYQKTRLGEYFVRTLLEKTPRVDGLARSLVPDAISKKDLVPLLPHIKVPVLVTTGEFDRTVQGARDAAALMPKGQHLVVKGAGHCCCVEDPATFDAAVIDFLKANGMMPEIKR